MLFALVCTLLPKKISGRSFVGNYIENFNLRALAIVVSLIPVLPLGIWLGGARMEESRKYLLATHCEYGGLVVVWVYLLRMRIVLSFQYHSWNLLPVLHRSGRLGNLETGLGIELWRRC